MSKVHDLITQLIAELEAGPCPTVRDLIDLGYALDGAMCAADLPEMLWMHLTFSDVADTIVKASRIVDEQDEDKFSDDDTDRLREIRESGL